MAAADQRRNFVSSAFRLVARSRRRCGVEPRDHARTSSGSRVSTASAAPGHERRPPLLCSSRRRTGCGPSCMGGARAMDGGTAARAGRGEASFVFKCFALSKSGRPFVVAHHGAMTPRALSRDCARPPARGRRRGSRVMDPLALTARPRHRPRILWAVGAAADESTRRGLYDRPGSGTGRLKRGGSGESASPAARPQIPQARALPPLTDALHAFDAAAPTERSHYSTGASRGGRAAVCANAAARGPADVPLQLARRGGCWRCAARRDDLAS